MEGVIVMLTGGWYKIPSELLNDQEITKSDILVFGYIADRVKNDTKAVSRRSITAATELSESQVKASIRKLCSKHYIRAEQRPGKPTEYTQLLIARSKMQATDTELMREYLDHDQPDHERDAALKELSKRHRGGAA